MAAPIRRRHGTGPRRHGSRRPASSTSSGPVGPVETTPLSQSSNMSLIVRLLNPAGEFALPAHSLAHHLHLTSPPELGGRGAHRSNRDTLPSVSPPESGGRTIVPNGGAHPSNRNHSQTTRSRRSGEGGRSVLTRIR